MLGVQMEHLLTAWSVKQAEQNSLKAIKGVPRAVSHPREPEGQSAGPRAGALQFAEEAVGGVLPGAAWQE